MKKSKIELAKEEALVIGNRMVEEVVALAGPKGVKMAMVEMIPDRMMLWSKLDDTEKKEVIAYIRKTVWW